MAAQVPAISAPGLFSKLSMTCRITVMPHTGIRIDWDLRKHPLVRYISWEEILLVGKD